MSTYANVRAAVVRYRIKLNIVCVLLGVFLYCLPVYSTVFCQEIPKVTQDFLNNHLIHHRITDELISRTARNYADMLDSQQVLLTDEDRKEILELTKKFFSQLDDNKLSCEPIYKITELTKKRIREILTSTTPFAPQTIAKQLIALGRLEKEITVELSQLPQATLDQLNGLDLEDQRILFLKAFSWGLDPHSDFSLVMPFGAEEPPQLDIQARRVGLYPMIEEVYLGPKGIEQLHSGDRILGISVSKMGGNSPLLDTAKLPWFYFRRMLSEFKGMQIRLSVQTKTKLEPEEIIIRSENRSSQLRLALIKQGSFRVVKILIGRDEGHEQTIRDFLKRVQTDKKIDLVILDLSKSLGGLLKQAVAVAGIFLGKANIVRTKNKEGMEPPISTDSEYPLYTGKLLVVVSRATSSSSEILAGALKEYQRALVVGDDQTFGKGTGYNGTVLRHTVEYPFPYGCTAYTCEEIYLPSGNSTQCSGVKPSIILPGVHKIDELERDQLYCLKEPKKIESFFSRTSETGAGQSWQPISDHLIRQIVQQNPKTIDDVVQELLRVN